MAPKRSPERDSAKKLWLDSGKTMLLKDIAEQLGVSETLVRKWKCTDKWEVEGNGNVTDSIGNVTNQKKKSNGNVTNKRGAPKGNNNAVGHGAPIGNQNAAGHGAPPGNNNAAGNNGGAPPGNKNAVTTGEFESIWFDCLTEEEQAIYGSINTDTLVQVEDNIRLFTLRERRMMHRISARTNGLTEKERTVLQERRSVKNPIEVYDEKTATTKVIVAPRSEMVEAAITEVEYRKIDDILKLEEALTRIQDKKAKWLALKHTVEVVGKLELDKLQLSKAKLLLEIEKAKGESKDNQHVGALRKKMAERKLKHGSS